MRPAGNVARAALVRQRPGRRGNVPGLFAEEVFRLVLRAGFAAHEFFPQAFDESATVFGAAAAVGDRGEIRAQGREHRLAGLKKRAADQSLFRLPRPGRAGRHAAERQPCPGDFIPRVQLHVERGGDGADIHFAALGYLVELRPPGVAPGRVAQPRQDDRFDDFARTQGAAAVAGEELFERHGAFAVFLGSEPQFRPQREQHGRGVADGRGGGQAAAQRRPVTQLPKSETPEHLAQRGKLAAHRFLDRRQRSRRAQVPRAGVGADFPQLRHRFRGNHPRAARLLFVDLDADLRPAGDEPRAGIAPQQREQFRQRIRPREGFRAAFVVPARQRRLDAVEALRVRVARPFFGAAGEHYFARRVADGPVARAAAQVAAKLVRDLPGGADVLAVITLEHRHDEAGRAVAALRAVVLDHGALDGVQRAVRRRDALDRDQFPVREHRQQGDATVDGAPGRAAGGVGVEERHGAGPAVAFVAAALGPHPAGGPQPVEQRGVRGCVAHFHRLAVEHERKAFSLDPLHGCIMREPAGGFKGEGGRRKFNAEARRTRRNAEKMEVGSGIARQAYMNACFVLSSLGLERDR